MTADPRKVEAVTRRVRACFNRLRALADKLHEDLNITAAMRAVIEALYEEDGQTVPQIARAKSVTRQHIQMLVNGLVKARLVTVKSNPADKRSPIVILTPQGRSAFERMRKREKVVLAELAAALAQCDLDATLATLDALQMHLDSRLQGDDRDA
jgi:DNA-binding MarR family transcriptional regulator